MRMRYLTDRILVMQCICRGGAGLGSHSDGRAGRQRPLVHDDDPAQAVSAAEARGRHAGRHPHARRGGAPGRHPHGAPRRPYPVRALPAGHQLPGRLLRPRRRRRAAREAASGRALHHRMERGRHLHHLRRHQRRRPAPHDRGQARGRRRRRPWRGGVRALGRRRGLRRHRTRPARRRRRRARVHDPELN